MIRNYVRRVIRGNVARWMQDAPNVRILFDGPRAGNVGRNRVVGGRCNRCPHALRFGGQRNGDEMRTTRRTTVATIAIALVVIGAATFGANERERTLQDYRTRMDVLLVERSEREWCVVIESGPTGPEPSVTLGRTVSRCPDGTRRIETWQMSDGTIVESITIGGE